ncbi:MAG TPA: hypothetical protein VIH75_26030 [Candidatus Sulfotelmatobacter sp.]|jgi:hypothetical protein
MPFPLHQHEWWFCQKPNCSSSDRVYGLEAQSLVHLWLQELKDDPFRIRAFRDLVRSNISLPVARVDATLVRRIEQMLILGQLHLHKKKKEIQSGSGVQEKQAPPFPLSQQQPRGTSPPPPAIDPPSFSSDVDPSAQAATLVAAAASGAPFCPE